MKPLPEEVATSVDEALTEIDDSADEYICAACGDPMSIPGDLDPTVLCNPCAQAIAVILAKFIREKHQDTQLKPEPVAPVTVGKET